MAFGIDDFFTAAAGAVNLGDTLAKVVRTNSRKPGEMGALLAEVRTEAVKRIDEAQIALNQIERMLAEKTNLNASLTDVIAQTPFWRPVEAFRLGRAKKNLEHMSDSLFRSSEDIAALARCMEETDDTGHAIVKSAHSKHDFNEQFFRAESVSEKIGLLRKELDAQRAELN
ncbi:MAG: hypothetical protein ABL957_04935 [Parvularculaceae bacterium]